jgi:hypothetical protein
MVLVLVLVGQMLGPSVPASPSRRSALSAASAVSLAAMATRLMTSTFFRQDELRLTDLHAACREA